MTSRKTKKVRVALRKNRSSRARNNDVTREFAAAESFTDDHIASSERISGRGDLTRHRTIITETCNDNAEEILQLVNNDETMRSGRVVRVRGLKSSVITDDEEIWECTTRRLLRTLSTDERHVVVAGDRVTIRASHADLCEGVIERIEPRRGMLSRTSRGRKHVLVAHVDQVLIIGSGAQPQFKPNLIDRLLVSVEQAQLAPIVVISKIDLIDIPTLVACVGVWSQLGYRVIQTSTVSGAGLDEVREILCGRESVITGQSGVGKTSLLNAIDPSLARRTGNMTRSQKGTHTTTTAELIPLSFGGYVVDTPGMRQFSLWDIIAEELPGLFRDIRCYESLCHFPNCTHSHEDACAVKDAVADGKIDLRRYDSYLSLREEAHTSRREMWE